MPLSDFFLFAEYAISDPARGRIGRTHVHVDLGREVGVDVPDLDTGQEPFHRLLDRRTVDRQTGGNDAHGIARRGVGALVTWNVMPCSSSFSPTGFAVAVGAAAAAAGAALAAAGAPPVIATSSVYSRTRAAVAAARIRYTRIVYAVGLEVALEAVARRRADEDGGLRCPAAAR